MKEVCVVGLGYIGLPLASVLASKGYEVTGYDKDLSILESIQNNKLHIKEPGLDELVNKTITDRKLKLSNSPIKSDIYILAVPTPLIIEKNRRKPDISYVKMAINDISGYLSKGDMVIIESTCPVGTTEEIKIFLEEEGFEEDEIKIAYCPERVIPGNTLKELISNDRVVGGINEDSSLAAQEFYKSFVEGEVFTTSSKLAEACKLVENSYRDVNIALANELSIICEREGLDVWELIEVANRHPRVDLLQPGCGVGGHCIAIDPWFIVDQYSEESKLIKSAREINDDKKDWTIEKIDKEIEKISKNIKTPKIAIFGLTFKPNIDDTRESPALYIYENIAKRYDAVAVDPNLSSLEGVNLVEADIAVNNSDVLVFLVGHKEFKKLLDEDLSKKVIIDICGLFHRS